VILGILLIVMGIIALGYQGITYVSHDRVVDAGPVHVTAEREHTVPIPPIVGGAALLVGILLVVLGARNPALPRG
jgi:hypothetical protein